ncbi:MAG: hypothetical protein LDLANPLL_02148 [Turneriella sp.]|nr:hypothetical protein [Turneriella sp.]
MRILFSLVVFVGFATTIFSVSTSSLVDTMQRVKKLATESLCLKANTNCNFSFDTVVRHRDIWAFSFSLTKGAKREIEKKEIRTKLETPNRRILEIGENTTKTIEYFREKEAKFSPLDAQIFYHETLNPKSKIVIKYSPDFLLEGSKIDYTAPLEWEREGISPGTKNTLHITGYTPTATAFRFNIQDLDDKPIPKLTFEKCEANASVCDANNFFNPPNKKFSIQLEIKAARKLQSDQPVFKCAVYTKGRDVPVAEIAIPFKPQPNYFLFGIVGFLFGALVAVMTLLIRSNAKRIRPNAL